MDEKLFLIIITRVLVDFSEPTNYNFTNSTIV